MHELALMGDVLDIVEKDARRRGFSAVTNVTLLVGTLAGALPDALDMAFAMFKAEGTTMLAKDAVLTIVQEEAKAYCPLCGSTYVPEQRLAVCPACAVPSGRLLAGETFQVQTYEGS